MHPLTDLLIEHFQLNEGTENSFSEPPTSEPPTSEKKTKNYFHPAATLQLIQIYTSKLEDFKSTTVRNEMVWQSIGEMLELHNFHYNGKQCENRMKYLQAKYKKKKDNMRNERDSGASPIHCDYFEELDEIFGKKPNINPMYSACSSRGFATIRESALDESGYRKTNENDKTEINGEVEDEPPVKRRKTMIDHISILRSDAESREEAREKRHQDVLSANANFLNAMQSMHSDSLNVFKLGIDSIVAAISNTN